MLPDDLEQVMAIERASFNAPWSRQLFLTEFRNPAVSTLLVALDGRLTSRRVAGYIVFWIVADEVHIMNLAVAQKKRRQGIGEELVRYGLRYGHRKGAGVAFLEVRASNSAAQGIYSRLGFTRAGLRKGYYDSPREDAVVMTLDRGAFLKLVNTG